MNKIVNNSEQVRGGRVVNGPFTGNSPAGPQDIPNAREELTKWRRVGTDARARGVTLDKNPFRSVQQYLTPWGVRVMQAWLAGWRRGK